jgi:S-adenosylmethionine synthetase
VDRVARDWVKNNLRYVDSDKHLRIQNEIGKSAGNLADIFGRGGESLGANDTSAAVGYAPETRTEILVRKVEKHVNSPAFQHRFPEVGEDVKVMGMRTKTDLDLTISIAFVDRFIGTESEYFRKKEEVRLAVESFAREESGSDSVAVTLNNLDRPGRGIDGIYLTVTGTSAESGDSGQVGRGNRVNGLFSLCRPPSSEATSGKNPVSHVGKIYNNMAFKVARNIVGEVDDVLEAHFWLLSKIGEPVDSPRLAAAQVILAYGANQEKTLRRAREVIEESLTTTAFRELIGMLIDGKNPLESNPLSSEK